MADVTDSSRSRNARFRGAALRNPAAQPERQVWVQLHDVRDVLRPATVEPQRRQEARIHDLSLGGIVLALERLFPSGTPLEIDICTTGSETPVHLLARVMEASDSVAGTPQVICTFMQELTADELRQLGADQTRPDGKDGRAWVRYAAAVEAVFHAVIAAEHVPQRAGVINVSAGGVALRSPRTFERGTLLSLEFRGLDGQPLVPRLARVVHAKSLPEGAWVLGCTFVRELSDDDLKALM